MLGARTQPCQKPSKTFTDKNLFFARPMLLSATRVSRRRCASGCSKCVITRPGERVAVDGVVVAGESAVDESPITGESVPRDKAAGARVFAGTINQSGMLEVEVDKVGDETTLARILRLVEEAQASQAPIQRIADKAAQWYVPAALATAALSWKK